MKTGKKGSNSMHIYICMYIGMRERAHMHVHFSSLIIFIRWSPYVDQTFITQNCYTYILCTEGTAPPLSHIRWLHPLINSGGGCCPRHPNNLDRASIQMVYDLLLGEAEHLDVFGGRMPSFKFVRHLT